MLDIRYQDYEYPFVIIAFEGRGKKGMAYVGTLQEMWIYFGVSPLFILHLLV